ncbi:hypothetical protein [Gilliamella sp. ESL0250]|uniref:hypothetical protein n=1 Tax=Gilliamella sp. ESL0250 TaxID=2705036 RepID=UPI001580DB9E|nr:hypothetical protein [Gilliamella sp. ESL0250]NUF50465.1 hypothetical protein [Gilliamella sp. ESL0250]
MNIHKRWLTFVLVDNNNSFKEMLAKIEQAFKCKLSCKDEKGRYIARAELDNFSIAVIDKIDRLSELLCDEHYTFEITIISDKYFNSKFESYIKEILTNNFIQWERPIWAPFEVTPLSERNN